MKIGILSVLLTIAIANGINAEEKKKLYRWVDNQGNVHFTDQPKEGAVEIEMHEVPAIKMTQPKVNIMPEDIPGNDAESNRDETPSYESVSMASPQNEGAVRNNGGIIHLEAKVNPILDKNHQIRFFLDGKPFDAPPGQLSLQVEGQSIGKHSVNFIIIDALGQKVGESSVVHFSLLNRINPAKRNNN